MTTQPDRDAASPLCERILGDLLITAPIMTARIRKALPEYDVVPLRDHVEHVHEQQSRLVRALMESRAPNEDDLARAAALGRLRASQGVSVEAVIGAYHIGNRGLWELLDQGATEERSFLPRLAAFMWESIELVGAQIAAGHSTVSRSQQARDLTLRHRLIELLANGPLGPESEEVARALRFDALRPFLAMCVALEDDTTLDIGLDQQRPERGSVVAARHGACLVVLGQGDAAEDVLGRLRAEFPKARVGVGLRRPGLLGAAESLVDARRCLAAASEQQRIVEFDRHWWQAAIAAEHARLAPLVAGQEWVVAESPHLVQAILGFRDSGFSVTATARSLHLHPNSVAYRLERWQAVTGWDPRTFDGLSLSLLAITLGRSAPLRGAPSREP